eukprot:scaffold581_cov169-Amphora_coffeaeformis.AAC.10
MVVKQVAVIGATGRLGRQAVQQLVDRGIKCKLLLRQEPASRVPSNIDKESSKEDVGAYLANLKGVSVVRGDIGTPGPLQQLLQGCDACLALYGATRRSKISDLWKNVADEDPNHAKQVNYVGIMNLLEACQSAGCRRLVRITGKGEDPTGFISVLINMFGSMAKAWNYEGERALRSQIAVNYTIIRPGLMGEDGPEGNVFALKEDGGDLATAKVRYSDIANLCIDCLAYDNTSRATLTAMTTENGAPSWKPLLEKVQPDRRTFPDDMLERHYAAVRKTVLGLGTFAVVTLAIIAQLILS